MSCLIGTKKVRYNILCFILQLFRIIMNKNGFERNLVVLLFVLVLVVFSFAERDSRKLGRLYTIAQLLQRSTKLLSEVATQHPVKEVVKN